MWQTLTKSDFPVSGTWVLDKNSNKIWMVCVKATFDIRPDGRLRQSPGQIEPFLQGQPLDGDFTKSLVHESDFFGPKPATDVLVNGSVWAPGGRPAEMVDASLQVGPVQKRVRAFGDRWWTCNAAGQDAISHPRPFIHMPLIYENAYGGWDRTSEDERDHRLEARNPVGKGFISNGAARDGRPLPNIEDLASLISSWRDRPAPHGTGAVACHWSPRRELAGTYDEAWQKSRAPLWAEDLSPFYFCAAPQDQQVRDFLKGGEPVRLVNLSPHGTLEFRLPQLRFGFATRIGRETIHRRGELASVVLEPDFPRMSMTWQSSFVCNRNADYLEETTVRLKAMV